MLFLVPIPEKIILPRKFLVLPNHSFTMNCWPLCFGALHYNWNKRNGLLPQTGVKSYSDNFLLNALSGQTTSAYNLVVHNVQWYCCVATNEGGSRTDCAWLEVNSKLHVQGIAIQLQIDHLVVNVKYITITLYVHM